MPGSPCLSRSLNLEHVSLPIWIFLPIKDNLKRLYESCGGIWKSIEQNYVSFADFLPDPANTITREYLRGKMKEIPDASKGIIVSDHGLEETRQLAKRQTEWTPLKDYGEEATRSAENLFAVVRTMTISS